MPPKEEIHVSNYEELKNSADRFCNEHVSRLSTVQITGAYADTVVKSIGKIYDIGGGRKKFRADASLDFADFALNVGTIKISDPSTYTKGVKFILKMLMSDKEPIWKTPAFGLIDSSDVILEFISNGMYAKSYRNGILTIELGDID